MLSRVVVLGAVVSVVTASWPSKGGGLARLTIQPYDGGTDVVPPPVIGGGGEYGGGGGGGVGGGGIGGGIIGGGGGSVGGVSGTCRYWCKTDLGQAYCCESGLDAPGIVATKPGSCPPVRPTCPRFYAPQLCSNDGACAGIDKCCFDKCLGEHVCKAPLNKY